jgi:hypothetical protein
MLVLISVLVAIAALFGWLSARVLRLPNTIGTMLLMAITSIGLELLAPVWPGPHHVALQLLGQINFERCLPAHSCLTWKACWRNVCRWRCWHSWRQ